MLLVGEPCPHFTSRPLSEDPFRFGAVAGRIAHGATGWRHFVGPEGAVTAQLGLTRGWRRVFLPFVYDAGTLAAAQ